MARKRAATARLARRLTEGNPMKADVEKAGKADGKLKGKDVATGNVA